MKRYLVLLIMVFLFVCPNILWAQELRYPTPPDSIRDRHGRVTYMLDHFWNEQNLADTATIKNPKFLLDYLYLLKQVHDAEKEKYIRSLITLTVHQKETFGTLFTWLDNLLYDSSSPYYDEEIYLTFLETAMNMGVDDSYSLFVEERLKIIRKNRVGHSANDFTFTEKNGKVHRLYMIDAPFLLIIFNNPNCPLCHQVEKYINNDSTIQRLLMNDSLKILAIALGAEYDEWVKHQYPEEWLSAIDINETVFSSRLYDIQRLPSIYLLDKEKRILLKEADYTRLNRFLATCKL